MTLKDIVQLVIKADAKDADEEIKSLNKIIKDMTDSVGRSSIKIEKLEENTAKLKDKVSVLNDELEQETKELSQLAIESQQAADITKKLSIETQQASEEYTKIKREVAAYEKQQGTANRKIDEAKFNLDRLAQANITSGKEWDKYTKQVEQAETKLEFVGIQLDKLNPELEKQAQVVKKCENAQKTANLTSEAAAKAYADQEKVIKNINTETEKYNRSIDANNLALEKAIDSQRKNIDVINQSIQATKQAEASTNIFGQTLKAMEAAQKGANIALDKGTQAFKFIDKATGGAVTSSKHYESTMHKVKVAQLGANEAIDKGKTVMNFAAQTTLKFAKATTGASKAMKMLGIGTKTTTGFFDKFNRKTKEAEQATTELGHDVIRTKEDFDRYAKSVQKATTELNQNSTAAKKNAKATKGGAKSAKSMAGAFIGIATALVGATAQYGKFIQGVENGAMQFEAAFVGMEEETAKMQSTLEEYFGVTEVGFQKVSAQLKIQAENLGMNTEEAQNFSLAAIGMVGALSATNTAGLSFAQTAERMASALRGEAEAAEMLGLSLGAVPMQEYISSQERFGIATDTSWASLSAQEQMALRLAAAIEQTAVSMGLSIEPITNMDTAMAGLTTVMQTASESVSIYQQATNGLKTAFEDFLVSLKPVMFALTLLATVILNALAIAFTVIGGLVIAILAPFQAAYDAVIELTGGSEDLSAALDVLAGWLEIIGKAALIAAAVLGAILGGAFAIVTQLAADFVLGIQEVLLGLTDSFLEFGNDVKLSMEGFVTSFMTAYTATSGLTAVFTGVLRNIFQTFSTNLKDQIQVTMDGLLEIIGGGMIIIMEDIGQTLGLIFGEFNEFFVDTQEGWNELFDNLLEILGLFLELTVGRIVNALIYITSYVSGFVNGLITTIQPLIDTITELVNKFIDIANTVLDIVIPPLQWFIDNILVPIQPIIAAVANLFGTVLGGALGVLLSFLDPVLAVLDRILQIIQKILSPIQKLVDALFVLIEPLNIVATIAEPIADFINGISDAVLRLTTAISDFMSSVGDDIADGGILDVFGSHSASAETASINASVNRAISATMSGFSTAPSGGIVNNSDTTVQVNVQGASKSLTTINREARIMTQTRGVTW